MTRRQFRRDPTHALFADQSHSIPDNVVALLGLIGAWNYSAETARSAVRWFAAQRAPLAVPDVRAEPRFTWVPNLDQERFRSMLSVPIVSHDRVIGVMNVQTTDVHEFLPPEVELCRHLQRKLQASSSSARCA